MKGKRAILSLLITIAIVNLVVLSKQNLATFISKQAKSSVYEKNKSGVAVSQQLSQGKKVVSVEDFGAVGDGIQDDTNTIQKAIDAVYDAGGGVVNFPNGIYKVTINPNTGHAITIRPKVTLQGISHHQKSVIKLADRQGDYSSILAGEKFDSDLSDFAMYDLTIDGNGSNNPVTAESDLSENIKKRHSLRIYVGSRISIKRCKFINQNNSNTITVNGAISDVVINNNIFDLIGGGTVDYDHSTIYTHRQIPGKQIEIANNYFSSRNGAGTKGARAAIEIHGDDHIVKDNIIIGFTYGINVTGYSKTGSSNNQIVIGNRIEEAHTGIMIWSYLTSGNITNPAISNSTIANNQISVNVDGWRSLWGNTPSAGIALEPNSDAPVKDLNILNNKIYFKELSLQGRKTDNLASGIKLWRNAAPNVESKNIRISGNKIKNSLASGIYIFQMINKGGISQNEIINPGQSNGNFHDDYRAGIVIAGVFMDVNINSNFLIDNQLNNTIKGGILSSAKCKNKCKVYGNKIQVNSDMEFPILRMTSNNNRNFEVLN